MDIGDLVSRKSYNCDIGFVIKEFTGRDAILMGIKYRLIADAKLTDLEPIKIRSSVNSMQFNPLYNLDRGFHLEKKLSEECVDLDCHKQLLISNRYGSVLHIDGDQMYLNQCLNLYKKLGIPVVGYSIQESKQPDELFNILNFVKPRIVVITGHDSVAKGKDYSLDLNDYYNSKYYVNSVKIAREFNNNYDELVIIAGGCKSNYEALMNAGANFASSPDRVLIEVNKPVYVASKIAMTSIRDIIDIDIIIRDTIVASGDIGGFETKGQCRVAKPKFQ